MTDFSKTDRMTLDILRNNDGGAGLERDPATGLLKGDNGAVFVKLPITNGEYILRPCGHNEAIPTPLDWAPDARTQQWLPRLHGMTMTFEKRERGHMHYQTSAGTRVVLALSNGKLRFVSEAKM